MNRRQALKLLRGEEADVALWNARRQAGESIPDLTDAILSGDKLIGDKLWRANLSDANLSDTNLSGANLSGANLSLANLWRTNLSRASLSGANLWRTDLSRANLSGANLWHANLGGASLSGANLNDANLSGAYLSDANLGDANLSGADLSGANLSGANLWHANLSGANLSGANLSLANLWRTNLSHASLSGAHLLVANLSGANLSGALLSAANCGETAFANVDLSKVVGLDSVNHRSPSSVGIDTVIRSKGKISELFLRGCGVPDALIEYLPSLIGSMQPIQFYSCFISHSSKDQAFADRLHSRMVQEKLRVWCSPEDMYGGRKDTGQVDQAIRLYDKFLLVLTKASMESDWVTYEIGRAVEREKREKRQVLFPIGLGSRKAIKDWAAFDSDSGKDLAKVVREYHIPDFSKWKDDDSFEEAFADLLRDLKKEA